ncbi:zinc finger protein 593 isoform X2 [Rhincodon typus]|uniref:zinc finger protein 593 isoform X2 n=1 Tax=Rhincodon typus TaxID=259920 RepID=UPI00202E29F7|nr:zinc finger protein 593 isoform X2 [Rhincodon typus]
MTRSKRIRNHNSDKKKSVSKQWKTKRRTKDLDQIHEDMKPENADKLLHQEIDYDAIGNAQFYCLHCALKQLSEEPYTQEEAERAAGMGCYKPAKKVKIETQAIEEDMKIS